MKIRYQRFNLKFEGEIPVIFLKSTKVGRFAKAQPITYLFG